MVCLPRATALFFLLSFFPLTGSTQNEAIVFGSLGDRSAPASWTFRIAFWRDPDLADMVARKGEDSLDEKLSNFGERFKNEMGRELQSAGFGDFTITLIEDYDRLKDERLKGEGFHLLHCDPAMYLLGRSFLETNREDDPYEILVEEASQENTASRGAAIWVRKNSSIRAISDLSRRHVAIVHRSALLGGAIQRAALLRGPEPRLREGLTEGTGNYELTTCGSVSDALLRLATGLATETPIEAAFLPLEGPGFRLTLREMGLKTISELPFRILTTVPTDSLPGFPLLVNSYFLRQHPMWGDRLKKMLTRERFPYQWMAPNTEIMNQLAETLEPLSLFESVTP